jgi:hypothetical protein
VLPTRHSSRRVPSEVTRTVSPSPKSSRRMPAVVSRRGGGGCAWVGGRGWGGGDGVWAGSGPGSAAQRRRRVLRAAARGGGGRLRRRPSRPAMRRPATYSNPQAPTTPLDHATRRVRLPHAPPSLTLGEPCLQLLLHHALDRPRAKGGVVALVRQVVDRCRTPQGKGRGGRCAVRRHGVAGVRVGGRPAMRAGVACACGGGQLWCSSGRHQSGPPVRQTRGADGGTRWTPWEGYTVCVGAHTAAPSS